MKCISKSQVLSCRQCTKRLWLDVHKPELSTDSFATVHRLTVGHDVGEIARKVYDPESKGMLLDARKNGYVGSSTDNRRLLNASTPIFEAGFQSRGAVISADILLPDLKTRQPEWRLIEVKSSSRVKEQHKDDVAIQVYVAGGAGVSLKKASIAHIDSTWSYPGSEDYAGLFVEHDLTEEAFSRADEVSSWISEAQVILDRKSAPRVTIGTHCSDPFECGYLDYCSRNVEPAKYPVAWLPRLQSGKVKEFIAKHRVKDMRDLPDNLLNTIQARVKRHTLSGEIYFDRKGAKADLAGHSFPAYFLDFETVQFAVPIWAGTRPYQQIPFQFSVHKLSRSGTLHHREFLDLSGADPSSALADALLDACGGRGPVYAYNAAFEAARITELAERFPRLRARLMGLAARLVDLLRIARERYYHPAQQGSWSIKQLLPALAPDLDYSVLDGVKDGGMASSAYLEAIHPHAEVSRKAEIEHQLKAYCSLDTIAATRVYGILQCG